MSRLRIGPYTSPVNSVQIDENAVGKVAILITGPKAFAVVSDNKFYSADGTFKVENHFDKILFDLGWENRKRKVATYSNGKIVISNKPREPNARVSREDCAELLNLVEGCRKLGECRADSMIGGMATHYWFNSLEEGPTFRTENFVKACEAYVVRNEFLPEKYALYYSDIDHHRDIVGHNTIVVP